MLGKKLLELVERSAPAALVAIACSFIEELLVQQCQDRACAVWLDGDGDERLALLRRVPGPGEDELLVRHYLPIDAADLVTLAVFGVEGDSVMAANTKIGFRP